MSPMVPVPSPLLDVPLTLAAARKKWPHLLFFADISKWQDDVNYAAASAEIPAVIIKASGVDSESGVLHIDSRAVEHSRGFASKPQGFYHYAKQHSTEGGAGHSGRAQAQYFISKVAEIIAASGAVPRLLALDLEEIKEAIAAIGKAGLSKWVRDFIAVLSSNPWGALPVIYTSRAELRAAAGTLDWMKDDARVEMWIAGYPARPRWPAAGPEFPFAWPYQWGAWQYTSDGIAPGFKLGIDLNVARPRSRTEAALRGQYSGRALGVALPLALLLSIILFFQRAKLKRVLNPTIRKIRRAFT